MNQTITSMNSNINFRNQLSKTNLSRDNPLKEITSKINSSKNCALGNQKYHKLNTRTIDINQNTIEKNKLKNQLQKTFLNLRNRPEVFTRLSNNKVVSKTNRKPSEDIVSENSHKYLTKPLTSKIQDVEISRDKNPKRFTNQPVQNMQKLLS